MKCANPYCLRNVSYIKQGLCRECYEDIQRRKFRDDFYKKDGSSDGACTRPSRASVSNWREKNDRV